MNAETEKKLKDKYLGHYGIHNILAKKGVVTFYHDGSSQIPREEIRNRVNSHTVVFSEAPVEVFLSS